MAESLQETKTFALPDNLDISALMREITRVYRTEKEASQHATQTFFDTFDWRLYRKNLMLYRVGETFFLRTFSTDVQLETAIQPKNTNPRFWWEFADSNIAKALKSTLDVRALLEIATVETHAESVRILNEDEKTVLRLLVEQNHIGSTKDPHILSIAKLEPLKGYQKERNKMAVVLRNLGLREDAKQILSVAMGIQGKAMGAYSSKMNISLEPNASAFDEVRKILRHLAGVMGLNEDGVKADIDTEFLHDFRVAVRRTRSALSQIKGVLPKEAVDHWKASFAALGSLTNRLRDLDVYLLNEHRYRAMLPEDMRIGLSTMFKILKRERKREQAKVSKALESESYRATLAAWEAFLKEGSEGLSKNAGRPTKPLAARLIYRKFKRVFQRGRAINDSSPDAELHRLRIECKKLRYLLEFFRSLFPDEDMSELVRQLKKLQENLGDFNDLCVQQESLRTFLAKIDSTRADGRAAVGSISGLLAILYQEQQKVRAVSSNAFSEFDSRTNAKLYHKLFN